MNLRKLKKHNQEKHGWWDTKKLKSYRDYPNWLDSEYYIHIAIHNKPAKKYVYKPMYVGSSGRVAPWRPST